MNIETVKTQENCYLVNGTMSVPDDPANRDSKQSRWITKVTHQKADVIEPDYVALRTGPEGYASGRSAGMQYKGMGRPYRGCGTQFPKTITGGTTIGDVPQIF